MERPVIALKVDVDTYVGTRDGVPRLLEILDRFGIKATFFFSMGPDNSGKVIRRIFTRKGFLRKQLRSGAPSAFGLKTLLYGTLLPAPMIASSFPEILRRTEELGHETGIHCWDHVKWHDFLPRMAKDAVAAELGRASTLFAEILGHRARSTAAPGWTVSAASLEIQDTMGLAFCSDARGYAPFYPVIEGRRFATLQIPTTWPTLDEIMGTGGITAANAVDHYLTLVKPGLNVHTIHAEMEGRILAPLFADLLKNLKEMGATFVTLAEAATTYGQGALERNLSMGEIPGRAGLVAIEGDT
ncbi:MAG TPA: 4-deoxy-4-formamido-L-arabinose-phosphoundecaprenol deformylase [Geobacteraceae bacterium]